MTTGSAKQYQDAFDTSRPWGVYSQCQGPQTHSSKLVNRHGVEQVHKALQKIDGGTVVGGFVKEKEEVL